MKYPLALAAVAAGVLSFASIAQASDRLGPDEELKRGDSLTSSNGRYTLLMQHDGNLVLYERGQRRALWASNTNGMPVVRALMQGDGNLVLYGDRTPLWDTKTFGNPGAILTVQDDGDVVIYSTKREALWSTGTSNR